MEFGKAIFSMQCGARVQRAGWNGKDMFIFMVDGGWEFECEVEGVDDLDTSPFICMKTACGVLVPWLANQADILAEDWQELD